MKRYNCYFVAGIAYITFYVAIAVAKLGQTSETLIYSKWDILKIGIAIIIPFVLGYLSNKEPK